MQCQQIKEDNQQCKANAVGESRYCYFHNPEISDEEKREAQTRGGKNRGLTITKPLKEVKIKTGVDIFALLNETIAEVRAGEIDPKVANTIGYLAGVMIKAYEVAELEKRLIILEETLRE